MKKETLWTKNYSLLTFASILGAAGGIAGSYAVSFLVYDETGSTFAAGLLVALEILPRFLLPMFAAPWMDRLPRKPFLVCGDLIGGVLYGLAGLFLTYFDFSYTGYLLFSLVITCISSLDSLAYNSIYPSVIPKGFESKGYTVSGMLYPVMHVLVMPVAGILLDAIGVANILMLQGVLAVAAAVLESRIQVTETRNTKQGSYGLGQWWSDFQDGVRYLKGEKGLTSIFAYMAVTNGAAMGTGPILIAFFRTTPGFSAFLYSFFSVAEFLGRSIGGMVHYRISIPKKKRFAFTLFVYQLYNVMDAVLLWIPYPLMLFNRAVCGFLGVNSATLRETAVQSYLPEEYRARVNAFQEASISAVESIFALLAGALGELLDYRIAVTVTAGVCIIACWKLFWKNKEFVREVL